MAKNIRLIILLVLVFIMILVWTSIFKGYSTRSRKRGVKAQVPVSVQESGRLKGFIFWTDKSVKKRELSEFKDWGRNPFTLAKVMTAGTGLNLMGIFFDKDSPRAIINDTIVAVGDVVEDTKVVAILPDRVKLSDGKNIFELKLWFKEEDIEKK